MFSKFFSLDRSLRLDYLCKALYSSVSSMYFILPIYFFSEEGMSAIDSTIATMVYMLSLGASIIGSKIIFFKIKDIQKNYFKNLSAERILLSTSGMIVFVLLITFDFIHSLTGNCLWLFAFGLFSGAFIPLNSAILSNQSYDKDITLHATYQRWFSNAGMLGLYIIFYIFHDETAYLIFPVLGGVVFVSSLIELSLVFNKFKLVQKKSVGKKQERSLSTFKSKSFKFFLLSVFLSMVVFMQLTGVYCFYLSKRYGIDYDDFAILMIANIIFVLLLQPLFYSFLKRLGMKKCFIYGLVLLGLGMILPLYKTNYAFLNTRYDFILILSVFVWTVGEILLVNAEREYILFFSTEDKNNNFNINIYVSIVNYLAYISVPIVAYISQCYIGIMYTLLILSISSIIIAVVLGKNLISGEYK